MSRDITERATPQTVTEWTLEKMRRHQAETCKCPEGGLLWISVALTERARRKADK